MQISFSFHKDNKLLEEFAKTQKDKSIAYLRKQFSLSFDDCEDIFQEAFITLYHNIQEGKLKVYDNKKGSQNEIEVFDYLEIDVFT